MYNHIQHCVNVFHIVYYVCSMDFYRISVNTGFHNVNTYSINVLISGGIFEYMTYHRCHVFTID